MARTKSRRICRADAVGVFRRNAISRESPVHRRQVGGLEPTVAREHVCGPDVISTATVNGAREGARVEIMSVGCPQTAGRYPPNEVSRVAGAMRGASRSGAGLAIGRRGDRLEKNWGKGGATDWDRTSNLRLRRPTLYPIELQSHWPHIISNIAETRCRFFAAATRVLRGRLTCLPLPAPP